jgi:hypothetical protein
VVTYDVVRYNGVMCVTVALALTLTLALTLIQSVTLSLTQTLPKIGAKGCGTTPLQVRLSGG